MSLASAVKLACKRENCRNELRPLFPSPPADGFSKLADPTERQAAFGREVARWAGDRRRVFWIATPSEVHAFQDRQGQNNGDALATVAQIDLPRSEDRPGPDGPGFEGKVPPFPSPGGPSAVGWLGWGPGPGGPSPGPGGEGPVPGLAGDGPRPPHPSHFDPPRDGKLLIVEWKSSAQGRG
jgi:hypothetical protein